MVLWLTVVVFMGDSLFWQEGGTPPFLDEFENKRVAKWVPVSG